MVRKVTEMIGQATVLVALVPASLTLLGFVWYFNFHRTLGLLDLRAMPNTFALAAKGLGICVVPLFIILLTTLLAWAIREKQVRNGRTPWKLEGVLLGLLGLFVWCVISFFRIASAVGAKISWQSWVMLAGLVSMMALSKFFPKAKRQSPPLPMPRVFAQLAGTLVFFVLLAFGSAVAGEADARDTMTACGSTLPGVFVAHSTGNTNVKSDYQYHLVAHEGGFLFLRDPQLGTDKWTVWAVPEEHVTILAYVPIQREAC